MSAARKIRRENFRRIMGDGPQQDSPPPARFEVSSGIEGESVMRCPKGWNDPRLWKDGQQYQLIKVAAGVWDLLEVDK